MITARSGSDAALAGSEMTELVGWALAGAIVLGLLSVCVCRRMRLRWTWAMAPVTAAPLAWALGTRPSLALAGGVLAGAGICAHWEREDRERGGPEAQLARDRLGVWRGIWSVYSVRRWRGNVRGGRVGIGVTRRRRVVTVPFGSTDGRRGFVCGAPGTGKTVDLINLAAAHVGQGLAVICVDPKGDRSLEAGLRGLAMKRGADFACWSPDGDVAYNPLARGGPTEVADKALAGEDWTEPHYQRQAQRYLGAVVRAMKGAGEEPTLRSVVQYFEVDRLDALAGRGDPGAAESLRAYLDSISPRSRQELGGVRDRLAVLAESELGQRLESGTAEHQLELGHVVREGSVAYFRLDSDRYPLAAQMLGAAIISDLVSLVGDLQREPCRGLVVVDEFAAVGADEVSRLLGRARSAGLSVLVATQTFADLDTVRDGDTTESLRRQVLANVDYAIAHRQSEPEAAETLAAMAGTRAAWAMTRRVHSALDGPWAAYRRDGTRTREREFVCHPDEFKRLRVGEAVVIEPESPRHAEVTRMWSAGSA